MEYFRKAIADLFELLILFFRHRNPLLCLSNSFTAHRPYKERVLFTLEDGGPYAEDDEHRFTGRFRYRSGGPVAGGSHVHEYFVRTVRQAWTSTVVIHEALYLLDVRQSP